MTWLSIIFIYAGYHIANIIIAKWNAVVVADRTRKGNPKQIEHGWYLALYVVLCTPLYWLVNIWFAGAVLCLHGGFFGSCYNLCRGNPIFYLSKTTSAKTDQMQIKLGLKTSEFFFIISYLLSIFFVIVSIKHS